MAIGKKDWFTLDSKSIYLTHGSFGGSLKIAFDERLKWQKKLECDPFDFIVNHSENNLEYSRKILSEYLNCSYSDLVYFPNPSTALNTVIKSLNLEGGDEVLTTNHEYGSLDRTWKYYSKFKKYHYKKVNIEIPCDDKVDFIQKIKSEITKKTKIIYLSHITSSTGLIFPIKEICDLAKENNIISIIDGAHAPGQIPIDILDINPDIYVGACHKWMCAPKGVSFLYANKNIQNKIDPLVISWGWESEVPSPYQFIDYHQYQGTNDISAYLTIPKIIEFFKVEDWSSVTEKCHNLIIKFKKLLGENATDIDFLSCSNNNDNIAQMLSFKIKINSPNFNLLNLNSEGIPSMQNQFFSYNNIRIPIIIWNNQVFMRVSIQAYNTEKEIYSLLEALKHFNLL